MAMQKPDGIERIETEDTEGHYLPRTPVEPDPETGSEQEDTEGHMVIRRPVVPGS